MIRYIVVMGVSGCGKSTVAALLAKRLGWAFTEGDALHPPRNVEKMRHAMPLSDADRLPWLHKIAGTIATWRQAGEFGVVACSALRRHYRQIISAGFDDLCFVYLRGSASLIEQRLASRQGHFMPASLLSSQFGTLEEPGADEQALTLDAGLSINELVSGVIAAVHLAT